MQLFHIDADKIHIKGNNLEVSPIPELIFQLRKVLRIQKGDKICIQYSKRSKTTRLELFIIDWTDQKLFAEIISSKDFKLSENGISMLIAMPNKREKAELITQKLTEIGVQNICFWVSEHSIIRKWNEKKSERLDKISREAVEQSWGTQLSKINFLKTENEVIKYITGKNVIVGNQGGLSHLDIIDSLIGNLCGVIGPEGGFSKKDLKTFNDAKIVDLGANVLRMETASIILAWLLKNI